MTNSAGAAVSCAAKYSGRPAVFVKREELNEIKLKISSMPKAWIGKIYYSTKAKISCLDQLRKFSIFFQGWPDNLDLTT